MSMSFDDLRCEVCGKIFSSFDPQPICYNCHKTKFPHLYSKKEEKNQNSNWYLNPCDPTLMPQKGDLIVAEINEEDGNYYSATIWGGGTKFTQKVVRFKIIDKN